MYSFNEGSPKIGLKSEAAYRRAKDLLVSAWGQGVRQTPMRGEVLRMAEYMESNELWSRMHPDGRGLLHEKYQRGLDRLPFDG